MSLIEKIWTDKRAVSILAGIFAVLSYPPFPFPFLLIGSFILLFRLNELCESSLNFRLWAYVSLLIWNIGVSYWLAMATIAGGIAAMVANSLVMLIPLLLIRRILLRPAPLVLKMLTISSLWVIMEWAHFRWDLSWPWLTLGNAFSTWTFAIQYISITGVLGVSFWVVSVSYLLFLAIKKELGIASGIVGFIVPIAISVVILFTQHFESDRMARVGVIQPNFDSYQRYSGFAGPRELMLRLLTVTDSLVTTTADLDLILWPENALTGVQRESTATLASRLSENYVNKHRIPIMGGSSLMRIYDTETLHASRLSAAETPYDIFNSALLFQPDMTFVSYKKYNLVPLVERLPFADALIPVLSFAFRPNDILGFGKGDSLALLHTSNTTYTPAICYDSVFGDFVAHSVKNGSEFIAIITNDGWWGHSSGHIQHFEFGRLRAIENRRWIARSANNGISGFIAPDGSVAQKSEYWTTDIMVMDVPLLTKTTLYSRFGDWIIYPMMFFVFLFGVNSWRMKFRQ